jgi:sugar phosphate isomerase/epimerase
MSPTKYSKGVFINVLDPDLNDFQKSVSFVESLEGVQHVEIWLESLPDSRKKIKRIAAALRAYQLIIHAPFIHQSLLSHLDKINQLSITLLRRTFEIADQLHAKVVTFHGGSYPSHIGEARALDLLKKNLKIVMSGRGARLASLENLPFRGGATTSFPTHLYQCEQLRRHLPNLRFTLDVGHCIQNGDDYRQFLGENSRSIVDIHLHDAFLHGRGHLRLGAGQLNLSEFLKLLQLSNYAGFLTLETISQEDTTHSWQTLASAEKQGQCEIEEMISTPDFAFREIRPQY